ncbi:hypothetical protein Tco_0477242 [Tanacetum coccineum]
MSKTHVSISKAAPVAFPWINADRGRILTSADTITRGPLPDKGPTPATNNLEEFCKKHYEKLLPIMTDKYEYERRKKEKLEEVKARLDFGEARKKSTKDRNQHILNLGQCCQEDKDVLAARATVLASSQG